MHLINTFGRVRARAPFAHLKLHTLSLSLSPVCVEFPHLTRWRRTLIRTHRRRHTAAAPAECNLYLACTHGHASARVARTAFWHVWRCAPDAASRLFGLACLACQHGPFGPRNFVCGVAVATAAATLVIRSCCARSARVHDACSAPHRTTYSSYAKSVSAFER